MLKAGERGRSSRWRAVLLLLPLSTESIDMLESLPPRLLWLSHFYLEVVKHHVLKGKFRDNSGPESSVAWG